MINTLITDDDFVNYLMTSDFNEGLTPDEYKLMLIKFRNFFRILSGKYQISKDIIVGKNNDINDIKYKHDLDIKSLNDEILILKNEIDYNNSRKLTLKERLSGKIDINIKKNN